MNTFAENFPELAERGIDEATLGNPNFSGDKETLRTCFHQIAFSDNDSLRKIQLLFSIIADETLKTAMIIRLRFYILSKSANVSSAVQLFISNILPTCTRVKGILNIMDSEPTVDIAEAVKLYCENMRYFGWEDITPEISLQILSALPFFSRFLSFETKIQQMEAVIFEDDEGVRPMIHGLIGGSFKFRSLKAHDTTPSTEAVYAANTVTPEEAEVIERAGIIFTDINDRNGRKRGENDVEGGIRRGRYALSKGIPVVFMSGDSANEKIVNDTFSGEYLGKYTYINKPFSLQNIIEAVKALVK